MPTFEIILSFAVALYFVQTVIFTIGRSAKFKKIAESKFPKTTVVVAARNEELNIERCLISLNNLIFPIGKLEIFIIDDNSSDKTGEIIDSFIADKPIFRKIVPEGKISHLRGKTNALAQALKFSSGEIILTTDADCSVNPLWAKTLVSYFEDNVALVNGFTCQVDDNAFGGMQSLDFMYLLSVASGTINLGFPVSCIGNNMSYRRAAYDEVGGYENIPFSITEDMNLLLEIKKLKKYKIIYPVDCDALVTSLPCEDIMTLLRQKRRWSIGGLRVPLYAWPILVSGYIAHVGLLLSPFFWSSNVFILLLFRVFLDFLFIYPVLKELNLQKGIRYFFVFQVYYVIYVLLLPFVVLPDRTVVWKERKF